MVYTFRELSTLEIGVWYGFVNDEPPEEKWLDAFKKQFECTTQIIGCCIHIEFKNPEDETAFRLTHIL